LGLKIMGKLRYGLIKILLIIVILKLGIKELVYKGYGIV
jgi:hypothetical protein